MLFILFVEFKVSTFFSRVHVVHCFTYTEDLKREQGKMYDYAL